MRKERLRTAMERKGLNVASLKELSGIPESTIWRLLREDATTGDDTAFHLASALQCSVDFLLGLTDDPWPQIRLDNLSDKERGVLDALRRGDEMEAIRIIVN